MMIYHDIVIYLYALDINVCDRMAQREPWRSAGKKAEYATKWVGVNVEGVYASRLKMRPYVLNQRI